MCETHPIADLFPPLSSEEYEALKADIAEHGIREDILVWCGQIIDGRHRYRACAELGLDPANHMAELDHDEDPVRWAISLNLHRRHLSTSQRAMVADKLREHYAAEAKERLKTSTGGSSPQPVEILPQAEKGKARDKAGEAMGVSGRLVDQARKVREKGTPELVEAVERGEVSVSKAAKSVSPNSDNSLAARLVELNRAVYSQLKRWPTFEIEQAADELEGIARDLRQCDG